MPKKEIGLYVEQNGILVPRILDSIEEARQSGLQVLVRSEHPQDYDGSSGLLFSFPLNELPKSWSEAELLQNAKNTHEGCYWLSTLGVKEHCALMGISLEEFQKDASVSYWEIIKGNSSRVVADSAIKGRYHVVTVSNLGAVYYTLVENGKFTELSHRRLPVGIQSGLDKLVDTYEAVRNLERFDSNHCPIMEFVTAINGPSKGEHFFLQYHRSRDFEPAQFSLDRSPKKGEKVAEFVRGATSEEGINVKLDEYHYWIVFNTPPMLPSNHEGSLRIGGLNQAFTEILARGERLRVLDDRRMQDLIFAALKDHTTLSVFMKPQVTLVIGEVLSDRESKQLRRGLSPENPVAQIEVHVEADGNVAYLQRV